MAYTATITKESVSRINANVYRISIKMVVNDGVEDVFEASASAKYNSNSPDLNAIKAALLADVRGKWDKFADEQGIYKAAAFDTMMSEIQSTANTYINQ